jgi:hypothetical protein
VPAARSASFSPDDPRTPTQPLLDWLTATGCSRAAIHFDVDTIDSNEIVLGLGAEPDGLTGAQVRRIIADIHTAADVVGITIAEFIPRHVMHLQQLVTGFPLPGSHTHSTDRLTSSSRTLRDHRAGAARRPAGRSAPRVSLILVLMPSSRESDRPSWTAAGMRLRTPFTRA